MTIFVDVLKTLIGQELNKILGELHKKINGTGYDHPLSREQQTFVLKLQESLIKFTSTGDDKEDFQAVVKLVTEACEQVQTARQKHGQGKNTGTTVPALNNIILCTPEFYRKLSLFDFEFLNKPSTKTPEGIVYLHACQYLGEDIFNPRLNTNVETRNQKEQKLCSRLKTLKELIKPENTLGERRNWTLAVLDDLEKDNRDVTTGSATIMPTVSLFGMFSLGSPAEWFAPRAGRFAEWISVAKSEIKALKAEKSDSSPEVVVDKSTENALM